MKAMMIALLCCTVCFAGDKTLDLPVGPNNVKQQVDLLPQKPNVDLQEDVDPPVFFSQEIPIEAGPIVYVLDFSSSMGQVQERVDYRTTLSRWQVVQREAIKSISFLSESIDFNVVIFGTSQCGVLKWSREAQPASRESKTAASLWITSFHDALLYGGNTPTAQGVIVSFNDAPEVVVLLTDGDPSACGIPGNPEESHRQLIRQMNKGSRIEVFGIGLPNQHAYQFCRGVAGDSGGSFCEIFN